MSPSFDEYLNNPSLQYKHRGIALTASSYKKVDHGLTDKDTSCKLATYGDALLKLALCKILFDNKVENITVVKQEYEKDEVLVKVIARHYNLLDKINFDKHDKNIPQNYEYEGDKHKYIATAVEALLAAYYLDNEENFELIVAVAEEWKKLIDETKTQT